MEMDRFVVRPGAPLSGTVARPGHDEERRAASSSPRRCSRPGSPCCATCTPVADLDVMIDVLRRDRCRSRVGRRRRRCSSTRPDRLHPEAPYELVSRMRASINVLGPLLARTRRGARRDARAATTSGAASSTCTSAGSRRWASSSRSCTGSSRRAATRSAARASCSSSRASVRPRTLLTAAVLAKGETVIENAAREPEIADLAAFLNRDGRAHRRCGHVAPSTIEGVDELVPVEHAIIGDRIEAGTLLMACGVAGGDDHRRGDRARAPRDGRAASSARWGCEVRRRPTGVRVRARRTLARRRRRRRCRSPGSRPTSCRWPSRCSRRPTAPRIVTENIFDNRFAFVDELAPHGCRRPHRGSSRRRAGRAPALRAPRSGPSTCAPAPRSCSPGLAADGEHRGPRAAPRRPRLPRPRRQAPAPSAPTSERLDGRRP